MGTGGIVTQHFFKHLINSLQITFHMWNNTWSYGHKPPDLYYSFAISPLTVALLYKIIFVIACNIISIISFFYPSLVPISWLSHFSSILKTATNCFVPDGSCHLPSHQFTLRWCSLLEVSVGFAVNQLEHSQQQKIYGRITLTHKG